MARSWIVVTVVLALLAGMTTVDLWAQQPEEQQAESAEGSTEEEIPVVLGEIIVTAQKRTQNVQDVSASISTLGGEDLETITVGTPDVRILSGRVPSVILESSFGRAFPRFYIRGLGNTDFDLNASQPVSMIVDEVVLENPVLKGTPLFDLERVEVLRGPQGTLFGRNTPAGIVKFETRKPTQEFQLNTRFSYGTYDTIDVNGGVGGPLSDTVSARFSWLYQSRSDWVDNGFTGEDDALGGYDTTAYRLQLLWEPSDEFDALLNLHGWEVDGTARLFRANIIKPGTNDLIDDFDWDTVYFDGKNEQEIDSQGASLKFTYDFDGATLTSITAYETLDMYSRGDIDGGFGAVFAPPFGPGEIPFASESADGIPDLDQMTQEFRLASNGSSGVEWIIGAYYFDEEVKIDTFSYNTLAPGNPQDGYSFQTQDATAYALFGSVNWDVADTWDLAIGARFSHDEKDFAAERPDPTFQTPTSAPITESTEDDFVSWDVTATKTINRDLMWYTRVATGFRAPSIQGRILFCADFAGGTDPATNCVSVADTEELLSFETGIKSILLDNRLRLNLTGYIYEVDGQQVTAVGGEFNTATLLNVDKTEGYGFEMDLEYIPSALWLMRFGLSYNPTKINDDTLTVAPCGGGCTVLDPIVANGALVDGNSLPHAPDWIVNGIINFRSDPVDKGFFGALDWTYYSEKSFFLYESEEFNADAFEIGLRLGYAWNDGQYEVALFGRNVTDEEIVRGAIDFNNLTGMVNDPRIVGLEFVGRF